MKLVVPPQSWAHTGITVGTVYHMLPAELTLETLSRISDKKPLVLASGRGITEGRATFHIRVSSLRVASPTESQLTQHDDFGWIAGLTTAELAWGIRGEGEVTAFVRHARRSPKARDIPEPIRFFLAASPGASAAPTTLLTSVWFQHNLPPLPPKKHDDYIHAWPADFCVD